MKNNLTFLGCVGIIFLWIILVSIAGLLTATVVYYVWNFAIADVFVLKQITFLQSYLFSLGLSIVGSLFKSSLTVKK